jgi:hypothetical protein
MKIFSTCLSLHNQYRASKIMKSEAEASLRHLTLTIFSRVHSILNKDSSASLAGNTDSIGPLEGSSHSITIQTPEGILLVVTKTLAVLTNLMETQLQTSVNTIKFALSLINICLESGIRI